MSLLGWSPIVINIPNGPAFFVPGRRLWLSARRHAGPFGMMILALALLGTQRRRGA